MDKTRFLKLSATEIENLELDDFTVTELKEIISETILSDRDKTIAELRFIKLLSHEKIASKLGYDKRTIYSRLSIIKKKLKKTIKQML